MSEVEPQAKKDGPRLGRLDYAKRFTGLALGFGVLYLLVEVLNHFHAPGLVVGLMALIGVLALVVLWLVYSWRRLRDVGRIWVLPRIVVMWLLMICAGGSGAGFLAATLFLLFMPSAEIRAERRAALKARRAGTA